MNWMKDNKRRAEWRASEEPEERQRRDRQEAKARLDNEQEKDSHSETRNESKQERLWGKHSSLVKSIKLFSILMSETTEKFIDYA